MKVVVVISANAEWIGVKEVLAPVEVAFSPYGETFEATLGKWNVSLFHAGWGKVASAGAMQYVIDHYHPDLVVNLGTCGGFEGEIEQNETILVERTFIYDIVELMGEFDTAQSYYGANLDLSLLAGPDPHPVRRGTLASADSDLQPEKIPLLKQQGAIAADWESGPLAWVAQKNKVTLLIFRTVSDLVSAQGSEAYNNIELFQQRTRSIMRQLLEQLPDWLEIVRL